MKFIIPLSLAAAAALLPGQADARLANYSSVIPLPAEIVSAPASDNMFTLNGQTLISYPKGNEALQSNASLLAGYIETLTGFTPAVVDTLPQANAIVLTDNVFVSDNGDAYKLVVSPEIINIDGASAAGNFYGIQTLRKAIPGKKAGAEVKFPSVTINDAPRFAYRGGHFDVARHFAPVDSVKAFIDMLALHNANVMHWHLTDDQGWRIELKRYPELAEKGQWRAGTCIGKNFGSHDGKPYGGYYTQEQIRDIIDYAAKRHITIIPEVDLPGHFLAALQVYPEYGCTGGPYQAWTRWGVSDDVLCAGNDKMLKFLDGVLEEVMELFPSEYIHIGGDECPKDRWKECPKCQKRIKKLGLVSDEHSTKEEKLQTFVINHVAKTVADHGKKIIGWDEIMEGGLTPGATVMCWRGWINPSPGIQAAMMGHDAIMTPNEYLYLDYYQVKNTENEPLRIGGYLPISRVYSYEPITADLTPEQTKHILGVQANLWTEYLHNFSDAMEQELPRFAAVSEVQWCQPDKKDFDRFMLRLPYLLRHYDATGLNYHKGILTGAE